MVAHTEVKVPVRVDLAGGWTDVNPYCTDFGGEAVSYTHLTLPTNREV